MNKAFYLNTNATWLISGNTEEVPNNLNIIIDNCRELIYQVANQEKQILSFLISVDNNIEVDREALLKNK